MRLRQQKTPKGSAIADVGQIRALASSIRQDIVDTVAATGPCSVADVARTLGRPADGLYYHVKHLLGAGLLVGTRHSALGTRSTATSRVPSAESRVPALRLDVPRKAMYLKYKPADAHNRNAVLRVIGSLLRDAQRSFRRGFRSGVAVVDGPRRNLWAGRSRGALSGAELEQVNELLWQLIGLFRAGRSDQARNGGKRYMYEWSFVLAPAPVRASRRS